MVAFFVEDHIFIYTNFGTPSTTLVTSITDAYAELTVM
jgi:hypothetical protein